MAGVTVGVTAGVMTGVTAGVMAVATTKYSGGLWGFNHAFIPANQAFSELHHFPNPLSSRRQMMLAGTCGFRIRVSGYEIAHHYSQILLIPRGTVCILIRDSVSFPFASH